MTDIQEGNDWVRHGAMTTIRTEALDRLLAQRDRLINDLTRIAYSGGGRFETVPALREIADKALLREQAAE